MKILVFDDKGIHLEAAKAQLKDHNLTVVDSYDQAQKLIVAYVDYDRAERIFVEKYGDTKPYKSEGLTKEARAERMDFYDEVKKQATVHPDFDVVLADLLVPASEQQQGDKGLRYVGKEMPIGIFIALLAAKNGTKYAAVFTDSSHHDHPVAACFDAFNDDGESNPVPFMVNGCKVILSNTRNWVQEFEPNDLTKPLVYGEYKNRTDTVRAKNWAALLNHLINA